MTGPNVASSATRTATSPRAADVALHPAIRRANPAAGRGPTAASRAATAPRRAGPAPGCRVGVPPGLRCRRNFNHRGKTQQRSGGAGIGRARGEAGRERWGCRRRPGCPATRPGQRQATLRPRLAERRRKPVAFGGEVQHPRSTAARARPSRLRRSCTRCPKTCTAWSGVANTGIPARARLVRCIAPVISPIAQTNTGARRSRGGCTCLADRGLVRRPQWGMDDQHARRSPPGRRGRSGRCQIRRCNVRQLLIRAADAGHRAARCRRLDGRGRSRC